MTQSTNILEDWGEPKAYDFARGQWVRYVPRHAGHNKDHPDVEYGVVSNVEHSVVHVRFFDRRMLEEHNVDNLLTALLFGDYERIKQVDSRDDSIVHLIKHYANQGGVYRFTGVTGKACPPKYLQRLRELDNILFEL